jgi:tetratricopeptide (TPR) repeat protein
VEIKALAMSGMAALNRGDHPTVIQNIEEALRRARRLGDESVLGYVLFIAAFSYSELGDARAVQLQLEQIELDHRLGNRGMETTGLGNLGSNYLGIGLYKQARAVLEQASQICKALGARRSLAYDLMNLAETYLATGDLRKARQLAEEGLQEISPSQDARGKVFALDDLGLVLFAMGDTPGASRRFTEAREVALNQGITAQYIESTAGLAACAVLQGQLDEARKYVHEAWDHLQEQGWVGMGNPGTVYRVCAETFDALGEVENARAAIESGHQALMEVADKINAPAWRQSFLENVPDHRAIMEMWERRKL